VVERVCDLVDASHIIGDQVGGQPGVEAVFLGVQQERIAIRLIFDSMHLSDLVDGVTRVGIIFVLTVLIFNLVNDVVGAEILFHGLVFFRVEFVRMQFGIYVEVLGCISIYFGFPRGGLQILIGVGLGVVFLRTTGIGVNLVDVEQLHLLFNLLCPRFAFPAHCTTVAKTAAVELNFELVVFP